nr:signal peptide peptidase-like 2C [Dermacentor andersoni]
MLISYCHTFDLFALGRRFYFYIGCFSYGMGMVTTFLALELMHNAQPALLYLVPFTIIPTVTTAWYKGHLFAIWNGVKLGENGRKDEGNSDTKIRAPQTNQGGREAKGGNSAANFTSDNAEGAADMGTKGRQRHRPKSKNPEDQGDEPGSSKDSNLPLHEGSSIIGGDGHGAADDEEIAASPHGVASPNFAVGTGEAERVRAGMHAPCVAVFASDECPATDVVPASHKRVPLHLGYYSTWEDRLSRFVLSNQRKNGLRRDAANAHATSPSTA